MNSEKLIAIVTGGAKGIGKAIAEKLILDNYFVVVVDVDNNCGEQFMQAQTNSFYYPCDISNAGAVKRLFEKITKEYGHIDLLVNNAGVIRDNMIWNISEEDYDIVMDINMKGTWLMCKEAASYMKQINKGRIVNIASRAWLGNKGQSNYAASKAGVIALTRVLALELGKYNVCVNAIAPGLIDTPLTQKLKPEVLQDLINAQPGKNIGKPGDVARAVAFLGSYENTFITGQVLYVDGGKSVGSNLTV